MSACASCGASGHPEWAQFCAHCGQPLAVPTCRSCGTELMAGARFCSKCGTDQQAEVAPPPPAAPAGPVAARRITTVLFGDLVGFTTLSESRDQEEMREMLSRFFDRCRQIVGRYGGTIEKFIGDAVMAVWGVPTAHEDDAERAVRAGMELTRMVADLGGDVGFPTLAMRVGLVTGEVAVTIGAEQQGMVAGDAVNTASRVQSAAAPGEVWVDETTKLLTSAAVSYVDAGTHTLKGKAEPMALWSARAIVASVGGASRADGLEAPFVGRDRELRLVKELFHSTAENSRAALLIVDGEPGVGKSRLGWEFFKYVDGLSDSVYWHQGRCLAYGEGVAYWALAEAVRLRLFRLADRADDDEPEEASVLISEGLAALEMTSEERAWLAPRVGALLGGSGIGTFMREELFAAWVSFFDKVSGGTEIVFLVDDAHHADEGLLAFVEHLLETAPFPCLVVLLTRPGLIERRPALATNRRSAVMHLPELESRDMEALVNGLVSGLPSDVSSALVTRAEGVPLYAVETVRSLIDRDLVIPRGGQYVLAAPDIDLSAIGAPASLQTLIAARLDALSVEQRHVVNEASILGSTFEQTALAELCPGIDVGAAVTELVRLQILTKDTNRLSVDFGRLKFVQSVVRQVAYGTLSRRDRKAGHLAAARYLRSAVEAGTELDGVIAQHFIDAKEAMPTEPDVPELETAAIELLISAAERSQGLGVPDDAAMHLEKALEHANEPWVKADLLRRHAQALLDAARYRECVEQAEKATAAFDDLGDAPSAGRAAASWARALALGGEPSRALEIAEVRFEALRRDEETARPALELGRAISNALMALGMDAREMVDARMRLAERLEDPGELADSFAALSVWYAATGAGWVARLHLEAAANLAREYDLPAPLARSLSNLTADRIMHNLDEAVEVGNEALEISVRAGFMSQVEVCQANIVLALWASGRWTELDAFLPRAELLRRSLMNSIAYVPEAITALERGLPPPDSPDRSVWVSESRSDTAWFRLGEAAHALVSGDPTVALEAATASARMFHEYSGTYDDFVHAWSVAGGLAAELGELERLEELLALVEGAEHPLPLAVRSHRARLRAQRLRLRDADDPSIESHLREAIDLFERWRSRIMVARSQEELASWLVAQGRSEEAAPLYAAARSGYREIGVADRLGELDVASS